MSESAFTNFFNNSQGFGLNVKVPTRTLQEVGKTASNTAGGVLEPLFTYLEENENVFSGDIALEINKTNNMSFNIGMALQQSDLQVNGQKPKFDTNF